ncbi:halocarboxylic acid dehydrogenase DehI family protein [Metabacillus litoralis]|uniref:halocarboxylic acid dehydrogenase DehI family protein n=1 Tax=Metabacillus litoralis TaxID=152268 RepID=UPI001F00C8AC|nr:halocarboxylic acid dehydrogenase DehI family protein [Metabacillus litoralis]
MIKEVYEDIKYVLKVPIVNFIFRALAHYPEFLSYAWQQVRPNMLAINVEAASNELRFLNITNISRYDFTKKYPLVTLNKIKKMLSVFHYVNPKLVLIASAWVESISNRPIIGKSNVTGMIQPGVIKGMPQINLVHIPDAPYDTQQILLDIAKEHHSFDVASDFRALANYPQFLSVSWMHLKTYIRGDEYSVLKSKLLNASVDLVHQKMPYPVTVKIESLANVYTSTQLSGIMGLLSMFQNFLSGLILEVEYMRKMIQ